MRKVVFSCVYVATVWQTCTCEMFFQNLERYKMLPFGEIRSCCSEQADWRRLRHNVIMIIMSLLYLEVSQQDEPGGTDPGGGEAGRVQDAVLMLLDHLGVAQQADQHH